MAALLSKQPRFITVPYMDERNHRKEIRLFGLTYLTEAEKAIVLNHPLIQGWLEDGSICDTEEPKPENLFLSGDAPMVLTSAGAQPVSESSDPKVNQRLYTMLKQQGVSNYA